MAEYIMAILRNRLMVVFSWGFNSPMRLPDDGGLAFKVNGYKHKGLVVVRYHRGKDLFDVELLDRNKQVVQIIEDVYFDSLVETIDEAVERTNGYKERVIEQYKLLG